MIEEKTRTQVIYALIAVVVIALLGWWLFSSESFNNGRSQPSAKGDVEDEAPASERRLTVEEKDGIRYVEGVLQPLTFPAGSSELGLEQRREVARYKKWILDRAVSPTPLSEQEKAVINISLLPGQDTSPLGKVIVGQTLYQFTPAELELISTALRR